MEHTTKHRWFVIITFFCFILLHQSDRLLIGPLTEKIRADFNITDTLMGAVSTGALVVAGLCFPLWGYLYDRFIRSKLIALASFIWGSTTILNALARTYPIFLITRSSTGIDDSSYPGLYSMVSDYFEPKMRGKIYGFLYLAQPMGYLIGMLLGIFLADAITWNGVVYAPNWRRPFYLTGILGIILSIIIFLFVKEPQRGKAEPEMAGLEQISRYTFDWRIARDLFKKPSMIFICLQGFFGVFPWNAITFWFFAYLERERGYKDASLFITMVLAVLTLSIGYPIGGALGDFLFKRTPRGRVIIAITGVIIGLIFFVVTMNIPVNTPSLFLIMLLLTAIFMPFPSSNITATVYDISLPEVRSTANALESLLESIGAAFAPIIMGFLSDYTGSLKNAFLIFCSSAWVLGIIFLSYVIKIIPQDIQLLRATMAERALLEKSKLITPQDRSIDPLTGSY